MTPQESRPAVIYTKGDVQKLYGRNANTAANILGLVNKLAIRLTVMERNQEQTGHSNFIEENGEIAIQNIADALFNREEKGSDLFWLWANQQQADSEINQLKQLKSQLTKRRAVGVVAKTSLQKDMVDYIENRVPQVITILEEDKVHAGGFFDSTTPSLKELSRMTLPLSPENKDRLDKVFGLDESATPEQLRSAIALFGLAKEGPFLADSDKVESVRAEQIGTGTVMQLVNAGKVVRTYMLGYYDLLQNADERTNLDSVLPKGRLFDFFIFGDIASMAAENFLPQSFETVMDHYGSGILPAAQEKVLVAEYMQSSRQNFRSSLERQDGKQRKVYELLYDSYESGASKVYEDRLAQRFPDGESNDLIERYGELLHLIVTNRDRLNKYLASGVATVDEGGDKDIAFIDMATNRAHSNLTDIIVVSPANEVLTLQLTKNASVVFGAFNTDDQVAARVFILEKVVRFLKEQKIIPIENVSSSSRREQTVVQKDAPKTGIHKAQSVQAGDSEVSESVDLDNLGARPVKRKRKVQEQNHEDLRRAQTVHEDAASTGIFITVPRVVVKDLQEPIQDLVRKAVILVRKETEHGGMSKHLVGEQGNYRIWYGKYVISVDLDAPKPEVTGVFKRDSDNKKYTKIAQVLRGN